MVALSSSASPLMVTVTLSVSASILAVTAEEATALYDKVTTEAYELMTRKNHDYSEAWRDMRVSSITDLIMSKVLRTKSIEDHGGKTLVSEGLDANYYDMINYAVFALILLSEKEDHEK